MKKIKRLMQIILCCCLFFGTMSMTASAKDLTTVVASGICGTATLMNGSTAANTWELNSLGILTITPGYDSRRNAIIMPDYWYDDASETADLAPWAEYADSIKIVLIGDGMMNIGECAFANCTNLRGISIPDSVTNIGRGAFLGCTSLTSVEIPIGVSAVESHVFEDCTALNKVTINGMDTEIWDYAFYNANNVTVYCYDGSAAEEYLASDGIDYVVIPTVVASGTCGTGEMLSQQNTWTLYSDGVLEIIGGYDSNEIPIYMSNYSADDSNPAPWREYAEQITEVILENVPNISEGAFSMCTNLKTITIPDSVQSIGDDAFYGCWSLRMVDFPASVKNIGSCAFYYSAVYDIAIYGMETQFADDTFNIAREDPFYVYLYEGSWADAWFVPSIHPGFYEVRLLDAEVTPTPTPVVTEEPEETPSGTCGTSGTRSNTWTLVDGVLTITGAVSKTPVAMPDYSTNNLAPWYEYREEIKYVVCTGNLANIGGGAFYRCTALENVNFGNHMTVIGEAAFMGCSSLGNIVIPDSVTSIGGGAFSFCAALEKITILGSDTEIGEDVFLNTNNVTIYGFTGTTAETYANENRIPFVSMSEVTPTVEPKPTVNPEVTETPEITVTPEVTQEPGETIDPDPTEIPGETVDPDPTEIPGETEDVTVVFTDVFKDWYKDYVQYVYENSLMTGIKGTTRFEPNANITKAQVAQVLYNMEAQPAVNDKKVFNELKDVYEAEWYANAVAWAYNTGVVTGDLNTKKFSPNANVTREQLALMMYRYAQYKAYDTSATSDLAGLANAENASNWAIDGVRWAVGKGLISGIDKNGVKDLAPQGNASRAQVAAILQRFCEAYKR